ncbi:MAG: DUF2723 domain-containing protein [Chloroflexi bacterium]|nr:DUF2723 domain-containing protein [Chloroflexota bacterium]
MMKPNPDQSHLNRWAGIAAIATVLLCIITLQTDINGSLHPYTTDVGEIQNALPRWGTLHFSGYPQYTFLGSLWVSIIGLFGITPAASTSLFSAIWSAITIALLTIIAVELGVQPKIAAATSFLFALSTSMWVDGSIAEIHTMTMALIAAALLFALRFSKNKQIRDLYMLAFVCGQGLVHQRSYAFIGLGLLILLLPHWKLVLQHTLQLIGLILLALLTYIYLPLRAWMGTTWTFSDPSSWEGFKALVFDNKADRILTFPASLSEWQERINVVIGTLNDDWPIILVVLGLIGLVVATHRTRPIERVGLTLMWIPTFILSLLIWVGFVGDALLAVKIPIILMATTGLALLTQRVIDIQPRLNLVFAVGWLGVAIFLFFLNKPVVLEITQDQNAYTTIELASRIVSPSENDSPITLMAVGGNDHWQLAYAALTMPEFPDVEIVDHNANFAEIKENGDRIVTLSRSFYNQSYEDWKDALSSPVYLSSVAPEVTEVLTTPQLAPDQDVQFELGNGIGIRNTNVQWADANSLIIAVDWQALTPDLPIYHIAVHVVSQDPPAAPEHVVGQADRNNPVHGWYPTSLWSLDEVVRDHFLVELPADATPIAVRLAMYQSVEGEIINSDWLSVPVPAKSD